MTQPDYQGYTIPVSLDTTGVVSGANQAEEAVGSLEAAMSGLAVGAAAVGHSMGRLSTVATGRIFGSASVAAAASFQKQMSDLAATSAVTGQSLEALRVTAQSLARTLPGGTSQAIQTVTAVQQLGLSAKNQIPQIRALSTEFTKLGAAIGIPAPEVANSFGQLNRQLASLDPTRLSKFADVLTTLHATSGASAASIIGFSQAIGPVAQASGIGESAILGISTAFSKLGEDGGAAATAVNKILSDLNQSVREGTNQMTAYANATGMTVGAFRKLYEQNPAAALTRVTGAISSAGAGAPYLLQTLGLDPVRTQRAILELTQSGGLGSTINTALGAYGNGATGKASAAAFNNLNDKMQRLSTTAGQLGEAFGAPLLKPLGQFVDLIHGLVAPIAGLLNIPGVQAMLGVAGYGVVGGVLAGKLGGAALGGARHLGTAALGYAGLTSGPVASVLGGLRAARYGPEGAPFREGSWAGGAYNPMINAALAGEQMGSGFTGKVNRRAFDLFYGLGQRYLPTAGGASDVALGEAITRRAAMGSTTGLSGFGNLLRMAAGGTGLGLGGYMRLTGAPFHYATQNALDREEYHFLAPGGATANLFSALRGGFGPQGDPKLIAQGLRDFGDELKNTSKVMHGFWTQVLSWGQGAAGFAVQTGAGAAKLGGRLGGSILGGIGGAIADNPIGAAALAGTVGVIGGIELSRSATSYNQNLASHYQNLDIYGPLNQFMDSIGQAGMASETMAQQMTAATQAMEASTTSWAKAATATQGNVQAWGAPNKSKVIEQFTGTPSQVAAQIGLMNIKGLSPQALSAVKTSLYNQGYSIPTINQILSQVPRHGGANLSETEITNAVQHITSGVGQYHGGFFGNLLEPFHSINALKGFITGTTSSPTSVWQMLGETGGGHPSLSKMSKQTVDELVGAVGQSYQVSNAAGQGGKYASAVALAQGNKILQAALRTGDGSTVVAIEQALTAALTGKKGGITGISAQTIDAAGSLANLIRKHGDTVYGYTMGQLGSANPLHMTPATVTSLQGYSRNLFGQYYTGGNRGLAGQVNLAITNQVGNTGYVTRTAQAVVGALLSSGTAINQIAAAAARSQNTTSAGQLAFQQAVLAQAQQIQGVRQGGMAQGQLFSSQITQAAGLESALGPNGAPQYQQGVQEAQTTLQDLRSYYQQRLMAQYNYQIQAGRSTYDFNLQMGRSEQDFHRQSLRNWEDYNRNLHREILAASAGGDYSPYGRIEASPVWAAPDLSVNLAQQNQALAIQVQNLHTVARMGLSQQAIQVLGLAQASNAQQLQELVDNFMSDPNMIKTINDEIAKRGGLAGKLFKNAGNTTYAQQRQDYNTAAARQLSDFQLSESRAQADFSTLMSRMAQDLANADKQATGSMESLQQDMIRIMHHQAVNWNTQLVSMLDHTVAAVRGKLPELNRLAEGTFKTVQHAAQAVNSRSHGGAPSSGGTYGPFAPDTSTPSGFHRAGAGAGVNQGFLLSNQSRPGTDTNSYGNPNLHWGHDLAHAPEKRKYLSANAWLAKRMAAARGWTGPEWEALYQIWQEESGFSSTAENSKGNYGIAQWNPVGKSYGVTAQQYRSSAAEQIKWGLNYITGRYGDPLGAWAHKSRTGWYSKGGIATSPQTMVIGEGASPELALPLNSLGANWLISTLQQYVGRSDAQAISTGGMSMAVTINKNTYHYDSRTMFTGEARFELTDPVSLGKQVRKDKARHNLTATKGGFGR